MAKNDKLVAAIDVGSNAIRMIVAELSEKGEIKILEELKKSSGIGKDTYNLGKISFETIKETCKILKNYKKMMDEYGVKNYKAVSTSGIRESENKDYVIDQIKMYSGLEVDVINNSQERMMTYKAIRDYLPGASAIREKGALIIDIGSGGVEVTLYDAGTMQFTEYVKVGSLRLKETLADLESITLDFSSVLEDFIESKIYILKNRIAPYNTPNFIGLGGESTSIYKACKKSPEEKSEKRVGSDSIVELYGTVKMMNTEEIASYMGISEKQAEMVVPSLAIFIKFMEMTKSNGMYFPRVSLRHGILAEMADEMFDTKRKEEFVNDIRSSVSYLGKRYRMDDSHSEHIKEMALKIFDKTKRIHGLDEKDRFHLELAALLHDIGKYININTHNEHSFNIINSQNIIGIGDEELNIIAHIARFHNEEDPGGIPSYKDLDYEDRIKISKLSAILKLCDAMDITHKRHISEIDIKIKHTDVIITAFTDEDIPLEKWYFLKKADFFEEVMGYRPILKIKG